MSNRQGAHSLKNHAPPPDEAPEGLEHVQALVDEFLVEVTRFEKTRRIIWNGHQPLGLNHPVTLELERVGERFAVLEKGTGRLVDRLGLSEGSDSQEPEWIADLGIRIRRLNRPAAAFVPPQEDFRKMSMRGLKADLFAMSGAEDSILDFRSLGRSFVGKIGGKKAFTLKRSGGAYLLKSHSPDLEIDLENRAPTNLPENGSLQIEESAASNCVVRIDNHWWRFNLVGKPLESTLSGMAAVEIDAETVKFNSLARKVLVAAIAVSFALWMHPLPQEVVPSFVPPEKAPEIIELQKPKVIVELKPKPIETPKPKPPEKKPKPEKPKPPEKKPKKPAPKVKQKPKIKPKPKAKVQVKPPKQTAKHAPQPAKVTKVSPKVRPAQARAPKPTPPRPAGPTPDQIKAANRAAAQANLAKSLGFLSAPTSKMARSLPMAAGEPNPDAKYRKLDQGSQAASRTGKSVLGGSSGGSQSSGPISTRNSRNVSSDTGLSGSYGSGKGLNEVQGKVALNQLYDPNGADVGGALGGGSGMQMSGKGSISESAILKVLQKYQERFNYCYEKALLTHPTIAGNLIMQWTINLGGSTSDVKVARSALNDSGLHNCMIHELSKIRFPSPSGAAVTVKFPFAFASSAL